MSANIVKIYILNEGACVLTWENTDKIFSCCKRSTVFVKRQLMNRTRIDSCVISKSLLVVNRCYTSSPGTFMELLWTCSQHENMGNMLLKCCFPNPRAPIELLSSALISRHTLKKTLYRGAFWNLVSAFIALFMAEGLRRKMFILLFPDA